MINQAKEKQNDPMELFKNITSNYTPDQMNNFYSQAEKLGFSSELLEQVKNNINTK
jgi:hypothetical protein